MRIMALFMWSFFMLVNSYYCGALTMFFASKHKVGFEGMRDVIKAYPEWELKVISGSEAKIANRAMAGDATLKEFVKRDHENPKNTRFENLDEAMNALLREQVMICRFVNLSFEPTNYHLEQFLDCVIC